MVYASVSLALAAIETWSIEGGIPDAIETLSLEVAALPARWYETRDESLNRFGDEWIRKGKSAALFVPSATIRGEWNVLLNPARAEFSRIKFQNPAPFEFAERRAGGHSKKAVCSI